MNYVPQAFLVYAKNAQPHLATIDKMMANLLPEGPEQLVGSLREIEAWYAWLTNMLAEANAFLDVAESHSLIAKEQGVTELDRTTAQTAGVAAQRAFRDRVDGLCRAVNLRLMLGMGILKHYDNERRGLGAKTGE